MGKRIIAPVEEGRIRLRLIEEADLGMTRKWRNQDQIRKWFIHPDVISTEQHLEWFRKYLQRDNDYLFIIEENRVLKRPVGQISIYNIDWSKKIGEFGRLLIGELKVHGTGLAKDATRLLISYSFEELGLEEIELDVFGTNKPAIAIYQACGFREISDLEGLKRMVMNCSQSGGKKSQIYRQG